MQVRRHSKQYLSQDKRQSRERAQLGVRDSLVPTSIGRVQISQTGATALMTTKRTRDCDKALEQ